MPAWTWLRRRPVDAALQKFERILDDAEAYAGPAVNIVSAVCLSDSGRKRRRPQE